MPPKQSKASGRAKGEEAKEEPLQAVIVADTFETKFAPFSLERPRCLIPLANTPLIEYTLEYLASVGVQELFFYAGAHVEQVEAYLKASKWMSSSSPFRSVELLRCMATSVGDIMRDLDQKQLINGDFICVSGDVVSDFPLQKALRAHKARREKDKNAIMTMCLRERTNGDHRRSKQIVPTFVIDPTKDRCLHYEESLAGASFGTHIDPEMLKSPEIDIRQDLIDCRIDICTPDMLSLWSDNFDNQQPRKDFLYGVLKDYELNGKTIHTYIIDGYYANRVEDPSAYAAITYDLQRGIASSLSLTNNVSGTRFKRLRNDIAKEAGVIIQRPTRLKHGTIIGEGSSIGADTSIHKTILGRRCQIGRKTEIKSAFIWDDVTIGSNVKVTRAIIGSEAFIGDDCVIEEGALISFAAQIPAGTHVPAGKRVTSSSTFGQNAVSDKVAEGEVSDSDEEPAYDSTWARSFYQRVDYNDSASSLASDISDISDKDASREGSRSQSFATHESEEDGGERFIHDTAAILVQRMQEGHEAGNMQSELMGLRFSGGGDDTQVQKAVAVALAKHIHNEVASGKVPQKAAETAVEQYGSLIRRENAAQTTQEQVTFLLEAQRDLSKRPEGARVIPCLFMSLYNNDFVDEETFNTWNEDERASEDGMADMKKAAQPFIDWLANAEEEGSEEEESGEEEDESE